MLIPIYQRCLTILIDSCDKALNNLLFDVSSRKISALLDFDWTTITHPCQEFFTGARDLAFGTRSKIEIYQRAILEEDFDETPEGLSDRHQEKWRTLKAWNAALAAREALRPKSITHFQQLDQLQIIEESLAPFSLVNEVMLKRASDRLAILREEAETSLLATLSAQGF